jgi:hypothetical protein
MDLAPAGVVRLLDVLITPPIVALTALLLYISYGQRKCLTHCNLWFYDEDITEKGGGPV